MLEFGELVEPETRAFWANYDDFEAENREQANIEWKWMDEESAEKISKFKRLFVIEGREIFDFVHATCLKGLTPVCQVDGYKTSVYHLPTTGDYLCITEDHDLDTSPVLTELLTPWLLNAEQTFVFSFQSAHTYNTTAEFDKRCFVRTTSNTNTQIDLDCLAPMEDCNIIYGVSAGVSTWRHINKLPFACFAVYMDCIQIDAVVGSVVLKLFNQLGLNCDTNYVLRNVKNSNLYI